MGVLGEPGVQNLISTTYKKNAGGGGVSEQGCDFAGEKRECFFFLARLFFQRRKKMPLARCCRSYA